MHRITRIQLRCFAVCCQFALIAVVGLLPAGAQAQTVTELRLEFGQAGLEVSLDGKTVGTTNGEGRLVIRVEVVDGQVLVVEAVGPTVEAHVERRILEAGVPDTWLLDGELRRRQLPGRDSAPSTAAADEPPSRADAQPTAAPQLTAAPQPNEAPTKPEPLVAAPPSPQPRQNQDPCADPSSFGCLQHQLRELESDLETGDCRAALPRLEALLLPADVAPHLDAVQQIAGWYLRCGVRQDEAEWLHRAVDLLEAAPRLPCQARRARQLAAAYETLAASGPRTDVPVVLERAVRYFDAARQRCGDAARVSLEWQLYFLLAAGEASRALEAAASAGPQEPGFQAFVHAWALVVAGVDDASRPQACTGAVDLAERGEPLPCRGLPQAYCREQVGLALVRCAQDRDAHLRAAVYLTPLVDSGEPSLWLRRWVAESWLQGEDFAAAAQHYHDLLAAIEARGETPPSADARRYGDAVLFWRQADAEALLAASDAYRRAATEDVLTTRQQVLLLNNRSVLLLRLAQQAAGTSSDAQLADALKEALVLLERAAARLPQAAPRSDGGADTGGAATSVDERLAIVLRLNLARVGLALARWRQAEDPRAAYQEMKRAEAYLQQLQLDPASATSPVLREADEVWRLGSDFIAIVPADPFPASSP